MGDEEGDVPLSFSQRGKFDRHHVEAMEEVRAEGALGHHRAEVPVRGGDDPDVDLHRSSPSDPRDPPLLEEPKQFRLNVQRQLANLVEEEAPAVGVLQLSATRAHGPRERAAFVAEDLALEERHGNRGTVDDDKGTGSTRAPPVDHPRDELLPGARLSGNEDGRGGRCDLFDESPHGANFRIGSEQSRGVRGHVARESGGLREDARSPPSTPPGRRQHSLAERVDADRLSQVVARPQSHGGHRAVQVAVAREDHDRGHRSVTRQRPEDLEPTPARHLEIEEDDVEVRAPNQVERVRTRVGLYDPTSAERVPHKLADARLVVDDQDVQTGPHHSTPPGRTATAPRSGRRQPAYQSITG